MKFITNSLLRDWLKEKHLANEKAVIEIAAGFYLRYAALCFFFFTLYYLGQAHITGNIYLGGLVLTATAFGILRFARSVSLSSWFFMVVNYLLLIASIYFNGGQLQVYNNIWFTITIFYLFLVNGSRAGIAAITGYLTILVSFAALRLAEYPFPIERPLAVTEQIILTPIILAIGVTFLAFLVSKYIGLRDAVAAELAETYQEMELYNEELTTREEELTQNLQFQAELSDKLASSEELFKLAVDASNSGIWDWDMRNNTLYVSARWLEIVGLPPSARITADEWRDMVHPDDLALVRKGVSDIREGITSSYKSNHRLRHTGGYYIWTNQLAKIARDESGTVVRMVGTITDITEARNAEQALKNATLALETAQEIACVGSFELNMDTGTQHWSKQTARIYDLKEGEKMSDGQLFVKVVPEDLRAFKQAWDEAVRERRELEYEYCIRNNAGETRYIRLTARPALEDNIWKVIGTLQDITRDVLTRKELEAARRVAEEAAAAKSQFLSTMSHEIRTPMNAVIGFTQLLLMENPKPDQLDNLRTLDYSANHLLSLINDILDYSKIDSGKLEFDELEFNVARQVDDIIRMFGLVAEEKNVKLHRNFPFELNFNIIGDTVRFNQVVTNLLGNAIKFTNFGTVTVSYTVKGETRDTVTLQFSIADTGIGIPAEKLGHIFDSFTQANTYTTREYGGTGLGLAICKKLIELQGGNIWVNSAEGQGSTFYFTQTFKKGSSITPAAAIALLQVSPQVEKSLEGLEILLVEDNSVNVIVASKFLNRWKAKVDVAENGLRAVEMVTQKPYNVVLMDLQMPVMDGYTATSKIRAIGGRLTNIPIIALTASASVEVKDEVLQHGMTDYVTKPFVPKELLDTILKHANK